MSRVAIVTGGNRGLGRETARQLAEQGWTVILTARRLERAEAAAAEIRAELGLDAGSVIARPLDVTDAEQARTLAAWVRSELGRADALVNNAGAIFDPQDWSASILEADLGPIQQSFDTNTLGALRVAQAFGELLADNEGGTIVNVSSGMGALTDMNGGFPGYRLSKAALNALTRILHSALHERGVRVNAVCPGWVRTDMGGAGANRAVDAGAAGIVWAATLPASGPSGGFFRDGETIDW